MLVMGLSSYNYAHGSINSLAAAVRFIALSPLLIPVKLVQETTKGIKDFQYHRAKRLEAKKALATSDISCLKKLLGYYAHSKYQYEAAQKFIGLHQDQKLDLQQMDQTLYLAYSYLLLSTSKDQNGLIIINPESVEFAWHYITMYSAQREQFDLSVKQPQENQTEQNCLCDQYDLTGDAEIFRKIRESLYLVQLNGLNRQERSEKLQNCINDFPVRELHYLDHGQVNVERICASHSIRDYARFNIH